jgi:hypothetical protein
VQDYVEVPFIIFTIQPRSSCILNRPLLFILRACSPDLLCVIASSLNPSLPYRTHPFLSVCVPPALPIISPLSCLFPTLSLGRRLRTMRKFLSETSKTTSACAFPFLSSLSITSRYLFLAHDFVRCVLPVTSDRLRYIHCCLPHSPSCTIACSLADFDDAAYFRRVRGVIQGGPASHGGRIEGIGGLTWRRASERVLRVWQTLMHTCRDCSIVT